MRVAILSKEFPPAIGGIGDHTDRLAKELTRQGHTISVVCAPPGEARDAFEVRATGSDWSAADYEAIAAATAATSPDVIVWQYNPFSIGSRGLAPSAPRLAASLARIAPLVLSIHELWFPWGRSGARGVLWAVEQRVRARRILPHARRWIVTTETRDRLLSRIDPTRVLRVPIGANIEPEDSPDTRAQARASFGLPESAFVVAHLGAAGAGRDLEPVAGAIRILREAGTDARLMMVGRTGHIDFPQGLGEALIVTGTLPIPRLSSALKAADAFVHADPAGPAAGRRGTLVAGMAHGLPIVAYAGPDHASELIDGQNILVVQRTTAAMSGALGRLASDPAMREQIGSAARTTYRQRFAWNCIGEAFSVVLEDSKR